MQHARKNPTWWLLALLIGLLAVSLSFASAANGIRITAEAGLELEDDDLDVCLCRIGVVEDYPGGVIFVLEETHHDKAMTTLMEHLASIGAQIGAREANGRAFGFTADGVAYRAVLGAVPNGTLVYLGH